MRTLMSAVAIAAALAGAQPAWALATRCMYEGQVYGEGAVICQAGMTALCMNGEWQTKSTFCNGTPDGAAIGGGGYVGGGAPGGVEVIEVPVPEPPPQDIGLRSRSAA